MVSLAGRVEHGYLSPATPVISRCGHSSHRLHRTNDAFAHRGDRKPRRTECSASRRRASQRRRARRRAHLARRHAWRCARTEPRAPRLPRWTRRNAALCRRGDRTEPRAADRPREGDGSRVVAKARGRGGRSSRRTHGCGLTRILCRRGRRSGGRGARRRSGGWRMGVHGHQDAATGRRSSRIAHHCADRRARRRSDRAGRCFGERHRRRPCARAHAWHDAGQPVYAGPPREHRARHRGASLAGGHRAWPLRDGSAWHGQPALRCAGYSGRSQAHRTRVRRRHEGRRARRSRRQGPLFRFGWYLDQAGAGHGVDEVRHVRRRWSAR